MCVSSCFKGLNCSLRLQFFSITLHLMAGFSGVYSLSMLSCVVCGCVFTEVFIKTIFFHSTCAPYDFFCVTVAPARIAVLVSHPLFLPPARDVFTSGN